MNVNEDFNERYMCLDRSTQQQNRQRILLSYASCSLLKRMNVFQLLLGSVFREVGKKRVMVVSHLYATGNRLG